MTLYDLLTASRDAEAVSLLWIRETYLKESVRLGGRVADLIYKGSVLDVSKSFVGPIDWAVEFSIYQNCWDGMLSDLSVSDGMLSGFHRASSLPPEGPGALDDLRDYRPSAFYSMELVGIDYAAIPAKRSGQGTRDRRSLPQRERFVLPV